MLRKLIKSLTVRQIAGKFPELETAALFALYAHPKKELELFRANKRTKADEYIRLVINIMNDSQFDADPFTKIEDNGKSAAAMIAGFDTNAGFQMYRETTPEGCFTYFLVKGHDISDVVNPRYLEQIWEALQHFCFSDDSAVSSSTLVEAK
jgi:hypothetical protein